MGSLLVSFCMIHQPYPPAPQLIGARSKFQQGLVHAELAEAEMVRVTDMDAYRVVLNVENAGRKHTWRIEGLKEFDERLPLWIGDCMHNFRSAFDHIAYELIKAAGLTPTTKTMFPLCAQKPKRGVYIQPDPGPHGDAMQIVEDAQPYNVGHESNSLAIMKKLDNVDKHRELLAVAACVDIPYYGAPEGAEVLNHWANGNVVKDGMEVMGLISKDPQPQDTFSGNVVLTTKLAQEFLPMPLHMGPSLVQLIEDITRQLSWNLALFDWFFATH